MSDTISKMKQISEELLSLSAEKLMFEMSDNELKTLYDEFLILIQQMKLIGNIQGVDEVSPMTFPFEVTTSFLREDVAVTPLERDEALKNASDVVDGQIRLPKVVG